MSEARDLAILEPKDNEGYGNWSLPCQRDVEIESLVRQLVVDRIDRLRSIRAAALAGAVGDAREGLLVLPLL